MTFRQAFAAVGILAACAAALPVDGQTTLPELPSALNPGILKGYLDVSAKGVQVYVCSKTESGWTWTFKAPEADLFDGAGARIGRHYGGPTWEGGDGGKVVGAMKASAAAPAADAIPWLLLDVKSRQGAGRFSQAAGILRLAH